MAQRIQGLEGRRVGVALADGSCIEDCQLVLAGHHGVRTVWLYTNGTDVFVPSTDVVDLWEVLPRVPAGPPERQASGFERHENPAWPVPQDR